MVVDLTVLRPSTQDWAQEIGTADVEVAFGGSTKTLTGMDAVAYLFGQALSTLTYRNLLDGIQLTDGRFEFPPGSGDSVTLAELADALRYKYGVDPLIEFAPGLGLRGYSVTDINTILERLNREFGLQFSFSLLDVDSVVAATELTQNGPGVVWGDAYRTATSALISSTSKAVLSSATEAELRQDLTEGGDVYVDRKGGFFINGVHTTAMDLTVTARLLAQDNIGSEYKVLMDEYAERNNLIAASQTVIEAIDSTEDMNFQAREAKLLAAVNSLNVQYGFTDALSELTAGQVSIASLTTTAPRLEEVTVYLEQLGVKAQALLDHYEAALSDVEIRIERYFAEILQYTPTENWYGVSFRAAALANEYEKYENQIRLGINAINALSEAASSGDHTDFQAAVTSAQTAYGQSDVFGWLRTFDVAESLLWRRDQNRILFAADVISFYEGINSYEVLAGFDTQTMPSLPPLRFDWQLNDWGLDKAYFEQLGASWDDGEQIVRGTWLNGQQIDLPNASLLAFMQMAELGSSVLSLSDVSDKMTSWTRSMRLNFPGVPLENLGSLFEVFDWAQWQAGTETSMDRLTPWEAFKDAGAGYSDAAFFDAVVPLSESDYSKITALLNTLISNKVRDGELDQAKLQTLTAQLQNNTEAMTALIKVFADLHAGLSQGLR